MEEFGELLTTSGLIVDDRVTWLTFSSGYDFGYLLKAITLNELPKDVGIFEVPSIFAFRKANFFNSIELYSRAVTMSRPF